MRRTLYFIVGFLVILFILISLAPEQISRAASLHSIQTVRLNQSDQGEQIVVDNTADSGPGSFRWALETATSGSTVLFDPIIFPLGDPVAITVLSPLPPIKQGGLTIDASQAGVILDGSQTGIHEPVSGLSITSDGNTIRGMQIISFSGSAIEITMGSKNNLIGGLSDADRNIISGNLIGIVISGSGTQKNAISGNYIGTDATGTIANGNDECAIWIGEGAGSNLIGGSTPAERNIISGNDHSGVIIDSSSNNIISGNFIGVDASGSRPLGNGYIGVMLIWGSQGNLVGGATDGERNIISANVAAGVDLTNTGTNNNTISGNYIGMDISGTIPLGNGWAGITLHTNADRNTIGGPTSSAGGVCSAECNLISANEGEGIWIGTNGNSILGNFVGTDASGISPFGNSKSGIRIEDGGSSNMIGPNNIIAFNAGDGVSMSGSDSRANTLTSNSIHDNGGSGIQIIEGGNADLEPPTITYFSTYLIRGTTQKNALVEIYSDRQSEGQYFEGYTIADEDGDFSFRISTDRIRGSNFTLAVTDTDGNTSQFTYPIIINVPVLTRALPGILPPSLVSIEPNVIGTNLGLAIFSVLFFGFTSTIFNSVLETYHVEIVAMFGKLVPLRIRKLGKQNQADLPRNKKHFRLLLMWLLVLLLSSFIESFLDPNINIFGFEYLGILITLFISALIVNALELGSNVFARWRWAPAQKTEGNIQWLGLIVAIACVILSRIMEFNPGYLYGIVGAVVFLPRITDKIRSGKKGFFVLLSIFLGGLIFWIVSAFLPNSLVELEPIFLTVFLMTLQGVFFKLFPLASTDGGDIWDWTKGGWLIFFAVVFFCFYHFILNPYGTNVQALLQNGVQTLFFLFAIFGLATVLLWLLFPVRLKRRESKKD